ncbi:MAG TPA: hypothetical protein VMY35_11255 [Phycisphaerae bacterium]|nr:hypothetical protein [Phycisphaerae bacterium]
MGKMRGAESRHQIKSKLRGPGLKPAWRTCLFCADRRELAGLPPVKFWSPSAGHRKCPECRRNEQKQGVAEYGYRLDDAAAEPSEGPETMEDDADV